jgi:hypothetical protein
MRPSPVPDVLLVAKCICTLLVQNCICTFEPGRAATPGPVLDRLPQGDELQAVSHAKGDEVQAEILDTYEVHYSALPGVSYPSGHKFGFGCWRPG